MHGRDGIVAERYLNDSDNSSIPHFISFPVTTPDDWAHVKERYRLDDPIRTAGADRIAAARKAEAEGKSIQIHVCGFYDSCGTGWAW
jgi:hypothetical protein